MEKILVTGATGFIGNYVIEQLIKRGCSVIATSTNVVRARNMPWFGEVKYIPFDLGDFDPSADYYSFFGEPDILLHLAWEGLPNYKSSIHQDTNYPRHVAFLENLARHGLKDITAIGTCFEYGMQEGNLDEERPAMPANPYALAKDDLRKFLEELQKIHPFILRWVRLFYMYGKGQNPNSLLSQLDKALACNEKMFNMSGGEQIRDFLPVEKVADYIVRIALQQKVTGIINCCSGVPVTVKQFVESYLQTNNKNILLNLGHYPYPDYEPMRFWGDNSKLKTILNDE